MDKYKRQIDRLRKILKPFGYTIRFRVGYWSGTDYSIELFKGCVHNTNRIWQTNIWGNTWADFDNDMESLICYFKNTKGNEEIYKTLTK